MLKCCSKTLLCEAPLNVTIRCQTDVFFAEKCRNIQSSQLFYAQHNLTGRLMTNR